MLALGPLCCFLGDGGATGALREKHLSLFVPDWSRVWRDTPCRWLQTSERGAQEQPTCGLGGAVECVRVWWVAEGRARPSHWPSGFGAFLFSVGLRHPMPGQSPGSRAAVPFLLSASVSLSLRFRR